MRTTCFLIGALLTSTAGAEPLYVRGAFNGWGTDNALVDKGHGVYEAQIVISPGNHAFKVGSKDWSAEWVIDPAASVSLKADADYRMDTHSGPEDYLFVKRTGAYRFRIDVSTPSAPVLRVTREADAPVAAADPHKGHEPAVSVIYPTFDGRQETARFSTKDAAAPLREYAQSSTMQLRDPGPQFVTYKETAGLPTVRSGNLAFDALFALAGAEMKQDSVSEIRDGNYNGGAAIACDCFETGEKWHYVWTRDLSYAANLGLAMLDPLRVMHSLDFKLSGYRPGVVKAPQVAGSADGLQIIQDTGSGGSWPVSTDRVTWAFGAEQVLKMLPEAERKAFAARALKALVNTIENDRLAAFDPKDGLYTGEQSFLDWRDQSYAAWITSDIASLASSKALSTNVGHYKALTLAAALAGEQGQPALAQKYRAWARALKRAINQRLWLQDEGMYSSLTAPHFDGAPMHKFDWLGQALAIVTGVADGERARSIVAHYPHGPLGAPVIYPQQQGMPVYHNRAMWPFVTAYGLKAAAMTGNVSVADAAYQSLMRGAALNLSNMENLEWLSGQPLLLDENNPSLIGPVINSKRQLWSVGAYLGMVIENVFGISATSDGIEIRPFITSRLRRETFGQSNSITLHKLRLRGKTITVTIQLPPASPAEGYYKVESTRFAWRDLPADGTIAIKLGALVPGEQAIRRVSADPYSESSAVFAPREPAIADFTSADGGVHFDIVAGKNSADAVYNVYRDGKLAAAGVPAGVWSDRNVNACYAVEAVYPASGNRSHHSASRCAGAAIEAANGSAITVPEKGRYQVQVRYHNQANQINLGISGGVKWLAVKDKSGRVMAQHVIQLPHSRKDIPPVYSTPLEADLPAGQYRLELSDFYNMSYLQSNSTFSAAGGVDGASNKFDIDGVRLLRVK
ncbi:MAG TPA: esterase [Telluria sp.]|nr:esterase [Telluria sp.]